MGECSAGDLPIELEREDDGRWIAEMPAIPGVIVYGTSPDGALATVRRIVGETVEDLLAHGGSISSVEPGVAPLMMIVDGHAAIVACGTAAGLLVGYVDGLPGAHTHAESLDELYLNLREVITLVTEDDSAPENPAEERLSAREN
jgi:predicted RNase H-like HicB family nuclease